jgi:DNA polymerase-4
MRYRKILHIDLDAFFCAVEEKLDPSLRGKAFAVGGSPDKRGVVSSCSYAARKYGVRSAMPMARALQLCPHLIVARSHFKAYGKESKQIMAILERYTPLIEKISIDEAFLDVTDLPQTGREIAEIIQLMVHEEQDLPCSLGVATNKLVAKIANNVGKATHRGDTSPRAIMVVEPGGEAAFLAPLPTKDLWGIGPKSASRLEEMGIHKIGELAQVPEDVLTERFGKMGRSLVRRSRGIDERSIQTSHEVKSVSHENTFGEDISDGVVLKQKLRRMSENVGRRLRKHKLCGNTVRIKLRWPDFTTYTRQVTIAQPVDQDRIIYEAALGLFEKLWQPGKAVRLLGVGVAGLQSQVYQLSLWDTPDEKERRLMSAIDELRERFGKDAVRRGIHLGSDSKKKRR